MKYTENFKKAVEFAKNHNLYLGTGNPLAKILIVGKELGFDNSEQGNLEITKNVVQWQENINNSFSFEQIRDSYNPIFPYKGQLRKRNDEKNKGTSATWLNYQKLHDYLYCTYGGEIVFHKDFFLTEINQFPSKSSKEQDIEKRKESIKCRIKFFRENDFFQSFPITILTCKAYIPEPNELFTGELYGGAEVLQLKGNSCKIYFNQNKSKVVILTRQLSNSFNKSLLIKISSEVQNFCKENNIPL